MYEWMSVCPFECLPACILEKLTCVSCHLNGFVLTSSSFSFCRCRFERICEVLWFILREGAYCFSSSFVLHPGLSHTHSKVLIHSSHFGEKSKTNQKKEKSKNGKLDKHQGFCLVAFTYMCMHISRSVCMCVCMSLPITTTMKFRIFMLFPFMCISFPCISLIHK